MRDNKELIYDYEKFRKSALAIEETTIKHNTDVLMTLDKYVKGKNFKKLTEKDVLNYLDKYKPTTRNTRINILRPFLKWINDEKEPDCIKRIKVVPTRILKKRYDKDYSHRRSR